MRTRYALLALALAVAGAGAWFTLEPPRVTLHNAAVSIDHPWRMAAGWSALAAAPILAALALKRRLAQAALGVLALVLLVQAWHVAAYRLSAGPDTLEEKQAWARLVIPWNQVARVESRPEEIAVWGPEAQILIDTSRFSPEQRATLDRTIARRIREH